MSTDRDVRRAGAEPVPRPEPAAGQQPGKRVFDLIMALAVLVVLLPLLVAVALSVRLTTRGPVLFRQNRLGLQRRPFMLYKFRTMYVDSAEDIHREYIRRLLTEADPPRGGQRGLYKLERDDRVTPIGRLLRRASVDELPQLLNVIKGEMSLVGPRPPLSWEADLAGPAYDQRFLVRPGLTGLWQVSGRNRLTMRQGLDLDIEYVQRQSFALDMAILAKTVPVVLTARGAT